MHHAHFFLRQTQVLTQNQPQIKSIRYYGTMSIKVKKNEFSFSKVALATCIVKHKNSIGDVDATTLPLNNINKFIFENVSVGSVASSY